MEKNAIYKYCESDNLFTNLTFFIKNKIISSFIFPSKFSASQAVSSLVLETSREEEKNLQSEAQVSILRSIS